MRIAGIRNLKCDRYIFSHRCFRSHNGIESPEEMMMRRLALALMFCLAVTFCIAVPLGLFAQGQPVPEIPFESVPDFLKLPPNLYLGETAGVAVNSKGHVFVFTRGNSTGPAYGASA